MSRERCLSLDRAQRKQQNENKIRFGGYVPERSPNRIPLASRTTVPQHVPSLPELYRRNYGGGLEDIGEVRKIQCFTVDDDNDGQIVDEPLPDYYSQRSLHDEDLPDEFLDDFEAPSFYDLPPNVSFDEIMCTMATPPPAPQPSAPTAAEKLDTFRAEVAEVIEFDDLRKRMAAHIGTPGKEPQTESVQVDDVRRRMAALIGEIAPEPQLCPYKIPPLPEDPRVIPTPPKDPKDVVAIIRRAQAIARLKALEESKISKKGPKGAAKRTVRGVTAPAKLPPKKQLTNMPKATTKTGRPTNVPKMAAPRKVGPVTKQVKECPPNPQHPPDYVPDEWAAAILRTRKLAGLKTTNKKLLPKPKTPLAPESKSPLPKALPHQPSTPTPPTFANIMERVATIRSRTDTAKSALVDRKKNVFTPTPQDELDEYEALEQIYGATMSDQYPLLQESVMNLQNRINALQLELLHTPPPLDASQRTATLMPQEEELDEYEALEKLYGAASHGQCPVTQDTETDLQNRINTLQQKLFQSPARADVAKQSPIFEVPSILRYDDLLKSREAMAAAAAQAIIMQRAQMDTVSEFEGDLSFNEASDPRYETEHSPLANPTQHVSRTGTPITSPRATTKVITPKRSRSPVVVLQTCPSGFNDAVLRNIDVPDFNVNDLPDFAFSAEVLSDAGFVIGDEVSLGEISMPNFEDDVSLDELCLEDVTSPDLYDLSISGADMALEPDYTLETTTEEEDDIAEHIVEDQTPKPTGLLTTMVNAVVDRFRNIFSVSKSEDGQKEEEEDELNLDSSLPNMFETIPPPKPKTPPPKEPEEVQPVVEKALTPKGPIVIPPHPKDPKDYMAIVKRAQAIQKKKAQEAAMAPDSVPTSEEQKGRREVKSSIPKRAPPPMKKIPAKKKKKEENPEKVYPPGEYSPSYARAVARARSLAGFKNRSALLNPERAAKIAELKAAREAEIAAIEALPPVERMRKKMEGMRKRLRTTLPRPSIEALGTLEAIRANLPIPKPSKPKWRPTGRLRADRRVNPSERVFTRDLGRVLIPTKITQRNKKGWREIDVMSPIVEETTYRDGDFMKFSPLKPHEGQMRLQYLKEQTAKRAADTIRAAEEAQAAISCQTPSRHRTDSPSSTFGTPQLSIPQFSPIQLQSPRTEETRREKVTTKIGANGGAETIREEVTETSTIENGEVHTSTRQVTTKTDEFGNVTCHIQEGKGLSGEDETFHEDLSDIEPPDFLETSDIPPPSDPSIPTPAQIIERIRSKVQQKLNFSLPAIPRSPRSLPASPGIIEFPQNLPDEELFDIETPEFERTPEKASSNTKTYSPIEKDQRMYAWGEIPPPTPPPRMPTPKISPPLLETVKHISPLPKPKSPRGMICIPPHPKDPKDYKAIVKRAQAIQKLKKQQDELAAKIAAPTQPTRQRGRVPISRSVAPPPKDPKRPPRKRMVLKKRVPKVSPKNKDVQQPEENNDENRECPSEPPTLPQEYRDAVARTRLIHGLKNKTAALNPAISAKLAAKKAAEEAAQAAFDALPEHEKIKARMEKVRKIPAQKRRIVPSSDILGTIAAIRDNMHPIENVLRQPSPYRSPKVDDLPVLTQTTSLQTPTTAYSSVNIPQAPMRARPRSTSPSPVVDESLDEFEFLEQYMGAMPEASEAFAPLQEIDESFEIPDISLLRPYTSPEQVQSTLPQHAHSPGHTRVPSTAVAPICLPANLSLEEFENLEAELKPDLSLDEFEALEAEAQILYNYDTPKRCERHWGRMLAHQFPPSPRQKIEPRTPSLTSEKINLLTPSPARPPSRPEGLTPAAFVPAPSMRMLGQVGFFQEHGLFDEEESETLKRPFITPRADAKPGTIYYDEMQDFKVPVEDIVLETSQLMTQTPPKNIQERFQRLKEAHEKRTSPPEYTQQFDVVSTTPSADFSPIRLFSPSGAPCIVPGQYQKQISPISTPVENEWLLNVDETPERRVAAVKQFRDLEDMPFDELEYEIEPSLTNISYEKLMSPPPRPSDIINKIRSKIQQQLQEREKRSIQKTPDILQMPDELTDEELFEISAPSFARTPTKMPHTKYKSPRVSLPMAWGEVHPVTPVTPQPRISTPVKQQSPSRPTEIKEKSTSPEGPIVIPPHPKDLKDYAAMVRRAQAIYKQRKQEAEEAARASPPEPPKKKGRVPISRWQGPPPKKIGAKPKRKLVLKKRVVEPTKSLDKKIIKVPQSLSLEGEEIECPAEPPPLPQEYRDAVARTRLIHGLKNRTAALNPKVAAKIAAKKAAEEAAAAAYNALPEHEKIKVRMEGLRRKSNRRSYKPTLEQIAYLEALKQLGEYRYSPLPSIESTTPLRLSVTPRAKAYTYQKAPSPASQRLSVTPSAVSRKLTDEESSELAEFEALEQFEAAPVCPSTSIQEKFDLKQRIIDLEEQLLEAEGVSQMNDLSLAEFEALEAIEAPPDQCPTQLVTALDMNQLISDLQHQQLVTPPIIDPRERYRQLIAQRRTPPTTPVMSPVKTPEIRYSPITFPLSPSKEEATKRAEKSTTQITRSGNNTIKEQVIETSGIVNGELQHFTNHVTTTTDPQGNVTCQINESKRISARDRSGELETSEDLGDIKEPSFLDTTPLTPMERPRPRDIIERVRRQVKESYRPEVPTGHLVELRTPPRMLPLPEEVPEEELLDFSSPAFERTPTRTPVLSPFRSPVKSPDLSIPLLFEATPPPPTPPLPPVSPLTYRIPSPEGPIVIPSHPKDPTDFKTMCRRARKIQQLIEQNEAEIRAAKEAEAEVAAMAAAEAAKPKKKERVPISRWTAPPPKKPGIRKKLFMRKRGDVMTTATPAKPNKLDKIQTPTEEEEVEYPEEPPPLPEHYIREVALARKIAGLKNRTAALNPRVAAREAAKAEEVRKAKEVDAAKLALLNATPPSPIRDYTKALSRMKALKEKGVVRKAQPSFASAAYLDAVKSAMQIRQQQKPITEVTKYESPKTRYDRILAERTFLPPTIAESPIRTPIREDIPYSPVRFVSPRVGDRKIDLAEPMEEYEFDLAAFENINELEELGEFEEPSFIDVTQYTHSEHREQYMPLTPPQTPPPATSAIISRIRQQYEQAAICPESPPLTPHALEFPEELPDEDLFELSAPSFAKSPSKSETPIRSPNITIPRYFEESPTPAKAMTPVSKSISPRRSISHTADMAGEEINAASPQLLGVCPGVRVKTPQGPILIPPHPTDPTDVAAMIRRAQLIQKLQAKEAAEKSAATKATKVRVPISRRVALKPVPNKGRLMRRLVLKKKQPDTKAKILAHPSPRECPSEPPELPAEYLAEVAKARILAGLKNKTAILNPKVAARQQAKLALTRSEATLGSVPPKVTPPPPDYATIMEKAAVLRAAKAKIQQGPTARELTNRQNIINRQQRQERKRLLLELERLKQQQGFDRSIEFEPTTPPPVRERLRVIKSRIPTETPASSVYPYSPVKTPDILDIPKYQPLVLPPTPPYQYLENVCIPDIEDMSMQIDDFNDYDFEIGDSDDLEFQLAEAEAANGEYSEFDENNNIDKLEAAQANDFDMAERIEMLQQQIMESPNKASLSNRVVADTQEEYNMAERMEMLQKQLLQTPTTVSDDQEQYNMAERMEMLQKQLLQTPTTVADDQEQYNMADRMEMLQKQLLQTPTAHQTSAKDVSRGYVCIDVSQLDKEAEQYDQQDIYDEMMADFEAMERECI
ncbi:titin-like [Calliphora vicina]|uniref:titin-like n=1 Tax=Calliphora vicina TaxID=7373 RepID=UPI00325A9C7B